MTILVTLKFSNDCKDYYNYFISGSGSSIFSSKRKILRYLQFRKALIKLDFLSYHSLLVIELLRKEGECSHL